MNDEKTPRILCLAALLTAVIQTVLCIGAWLFQAPLLQLFHYSEGGDLTGTATLLIAPLLRLAVCFVLYLLIVPESRREPSAERRALPLTAAIAAPLVLTVLSMSAGRLLTLWISRRTDASALARYNIISQLMSYPAAAGIFTWVSFAAAAGMLFARRNINQSV